MICSQCGMKITKGQSRGWQIIDGKKEWHHIAPRDCIDSLKREVSRLLDALGVSGGADNTNSNEGGH